MIICCLCSSPGVHVEWSPEVPQGQAEVPDQQDHVWPQGGQQHAGSQLGQEVNNI